jgi:hypothetical protein
MDIDSVLGELDDSVGEAVKPTILEELTRVDRRAFELAELVARDPEQRAQVEDEASRLSDRLDLLADKLEAEHADLYEQWSDRISEAYLDLSYVESDSDHVSLRLGDILR